MNQRKEVKRILNGMSFNNIAALNRVAANIEIEFDDNGCHNIYINNVFFGQIYDMVIMNDMEPEFWNMPDRFLLRIPSMDIEDGADFICDLKTDWSTTDLARLILTGLYRVGINSNSNHSELVYLYNRCKTISSVYHSDHNGYSTSMGECLKHLYQKHAPLWCSTAHLTL